MLLKSAQERFDINQVEKELKRLNVKTKSIHQGILLK